MARIGLVSCASRKAVSATSADSLYRSALFDLSNRFVRRTCDRWFILSAKHGLLDPCKVIEPYDQTLNRMKRFERRVWADRVSIQLSAEVRAGDTLVIIAGQKYCEDLLPLLAPMGLLYERPTQGMRIGKQLQWLKGKLNERHA